VTATANASGRSGLFGGASFGVRIDNSGSFNNGGSTIHGVDNTFVASYQKLSLNGSSLEFMTDYGTKLTIASTGAATFSSSVTATTGLTVGSLGSGSNAIITLANNASGSPRTIYYKASDATINFTGTGGTDQVTITNGGNVGIGTASPSSILELSSTAPVLTLNGNAGSAVDTIRFNSLGTTYASIISNAQSGEQRYSIGPIAGWGGYHTFYTDTTERMRITSGGDLIVGKSSFVSNSLRIDANGIMSNSRGGTGTNSHCNFFNDNGLVGSITTSGSSTSFNTSSDYRLKENIKPVVNALSKLNELKPCLFNFIADADEEVMGFIAHEVQEVIPQAVTGEKDGFRIEEVEVSPAELDEEGNVITEAVVEEKEIPVYQGIDHSKLVPLLVAAIQELKAEIDSLKTK